MASLIQKHYGVLSGLVLFSSTAICKSIATSHFSTGMPWVFPISQTTDDVKQSDDALQNMHLDRQSPLAALAESVDLRGKDSLPTPWQVLIIFEFLAVQSWITTLIIMVLAFNKLVTK